MRDDHGAWRQAGPLAPSVRLSELIAARLSRLPDQLRAAMAMVAVGAPLLLVLLEEVAGDHLQVLDEANHIDVRADGGEPVVVPAHPLYGELFREAPGFTAVRAANRALLDGAVRLPAVPDAIRAAVWQQDSGTLDRPDIVVVGARAALSRHDAELTEQSVRPFAAGSSDAGILLGRALNLQHRYEEAERVLHSIEPTESTRAAELASARAHNLAFGLGQSSEAIQVLAEAARVAGSAIESTWRSSSGMAPDLAGRLEDGARTAAIAVSMMSVVGSVRTGTAGPRIERPRAWAARRPPQW